MIEDAEMRDLFRIESSEHIQSIEQGLLKIEKDPGNKAMLDELFREAHSLKGASRMLELSAIESIFHRFEDILGKTSKGGFSLASETIDAMYKALEEVKKLVDEAVNGTAVQVDVNGVLTLLGSTIFGRTEYLTTPVTGPVSSAQSLPSDLDPMIAAAIERTTKQSFEGDSNPRLHKEIPSFSESSLPTFLTNGSELNDQETVELTSHQAHAELNPIVPAVISSEIRSNTEPIETPESLPDGQGTPPAILPSEPTPTPQTPPKIAVEQRIVEERPITPNEVKRTPQIDRIGQFVIETIRVETRKLDTLMTHAGELTVAKIRVARRHADVEEIQERFDYLFTALRNLGPAATPLIPVAEQVSELLERMDINITEDSARLEFVAGELEEGIRNIRLLPFSTIFSMYGSMVRKLARECKKEVELFIEGADITADKRVLEEMKDPLMHILRNAVDHGIEEPEIRVKNGKPACGNILIHAYQIGSNIMIDVRDDGQGLDVEAIKRTAKKNRVVQAEDLETMSTEQIYDLIFMPGFSTSTFVSDVSGRGVGMDVVRANVEKLKGVVEIKSVPGKSCTIGIKLPVTLATTRVLLIVSDQNKYAVPAEYVLKSYPLKSKDIFTIEGHWATMFEDRAISVMALNEILKFRRSDFVQKKVSNEIQKEGTSRSCIVLQVSGERFGLLVDELLDEQEIVLKAQSTILQSISDISGATILGTGEVCMVLNPLDFVNKLKQQQQKIQVAAQPTRSKEKCCILLAEDSLTTRAQMKRILESDGYEVVACVDGLDAYSKLGSREFDAIVSDINMPNLDGLQLTQKVRDNKKYADLPIVLVTMLSTEEDKRRGLEVGANAYISKAAFDQKLLLEALRRLV